MILVPALLEENTEKLIVQINRINEELPEAPHLHIDIMDGHFVDSKNDIEAEIIGRLNAKTPFELHLMVKDPIAYMRAWRSVENVFRVLFHHEAPGDPLHLINFARKEGWDVGVVLNPETPLEEAEPYLSKIDVLQCMTVHPGRQGAPFVPEVVEKIEAFSKLKPVCEYSGNSVACAADGAVSEVTIKDLKNAGVEICNVGSFLMKAKEMGMVYEKLRTLIED